MSPDEVRNSNDLRQLIESRDVEYVTVAMPDMQGLLRGKYMSRSKFLGALESGFGMPPVVFALDPTDAILDMPGVSDDGCSFPDGVARILPETLPETLREIPWERLHLHRGDCALGGFRGGARAVRRPLRRDLRGLARLPGPRVPRPGHRRRVKSLLRIQLRSFPPARAGIEPASNRHGAPGYRVATSDLGSSLRHFTLYIK